MRSQEAIYQGMLRAHFVIKEELIAVSSTLKAISVS